MTIEINEVPEKSLTVPAGSKLLQTLAGNGVFLPSACGGGGTCAQCKCKVLDGGGSPLPTEEPHFTCGELRDGWRLSCQVRSSRGMKIEVERSCLGLKNGSVRWLSNDNVATFIKELVLKLPKGEDVNFRAGGYVQLETPVHTVHYRDFAIDQQYRGDWINSTCGSTRPRSPSQ